MDRRVMDYISRKMRDSRRGNDSRDYDERDYDERDYEDRRRDNRDYEDGRDYKDYRRGVRGSGNRDRRDYDERDYHEKLRLTKSDKHRWKKMMENVDGTQGEHYSMEDVEHVADKLNIKFHDYDEKEFCLALNMMYSDYCKVVRKHIPPDKELMFYGEMAKAFLEDPDGPEPSEKLALYFHCIVNADDV
jgi:hypothetical protein